MFCFVLFFSFPQPLSFAASHSTSPLLPQYSRMQKNEDSAACLILLHSPCYNFRWLAEGGRTSTTINLLLNNANLDAETAAIEPSLSPSSFLLTVPLFLCLRFPLFCLLFMPHSLFFFSPGCNFHEDIFNARYSSTFLLNLGACVFCESLFSVWAGSNSLLTTRRGQIPCS